LKKLFSSALLLSLFIYGCSNSPQSDDKVKIENKLHKNIVCILGYDYPNLKLDFTNKQFLLANCNRFEIDTGKINAIDTLGLCKKDVWNTYIKHNMLMLFVFDKDKLTPSDKLEDALIERYYFTYIQLMKINGNITVE
jgi:hypothetical protein